MPADVPLGGDILVATQDIEQGAANPPAPIIQDVFEGVLNEAVHSAWQQIRGPACEALTSFLGRPDMIRNGVSLYDFDCRLSEQGPLLVDQQQDATDGTLAFTYRLEKNLLIFTSTTPTVLGSYADPRISFDYNVELSLRLQIPSTTRPLHIEARGARITEPHIDSQNFAGDVLEVVNSISAWLGGPDFIAQAEASIAKFDFSGPLNSALEPVNKALENYAKQGYGFLDGLVRGMNGKDGGLRGQSLGAPAGGAPQLVLVLHPVSGPGSIEGQISWPTEAGVPEIDALANLEFVPGREHRVRQVTACDAFEFEALAVTKDDAGVFTESHLPIPAKVTSCEVVDEGARHVVRYALSGLPTDRPLELSVRARSEFPWSGPAAGMNKTVKPSGWSGTITLLPGTPAHVEEPVARVGERRARGASEAVGVGLRRAMRSGIPDPESAVELNPQPIPPGRSGALRPGGRLGERTIGQRGLEEELSRQAASRSVSARPELENPTAVLAVGGIDFEVELVAPPK